MDRQLISSICTQVYRKFPETNGSQPKVTATTADGRSLPRTVRVVADSKGKILKMTTSH
jgi:hypothetical protein